MLLINSQNLPGGLSFVKHNFVYYGDKNQTSYTENRIMWYPL